VKHPLKGESAERRTSYLLQRASTFISKTLKGEGEINPSERDKSPAVTAGRGENLHRRIRKVPGANE